MGVVMMKNCLLLYKRVSNKIKILTTSVIDVNSKGFLIRSGDNFFFVPWSESGGVDKK